MKKWKVFFEKLRTSQKQEERHNVGIFEFFLNMSKKIFFFRGISASSFSKARRKRFFSKQATIKRHTKKF